MDLTNCRQLVLVKHISGVNAELLCCELGADGLWNQVLAAPAIIGKNGVSAHHVEGDMASPIGLYKLGVAFSTEEAVPFDYPCRTIGPNSWWVDDPASPLYNQWVECETPEGFSSAEKLDSQPQAYHYGMVVEYNTDPIIPGRGSAIFFHCYGRLGYTHGCVSVEECVMLEVLKWLRPECAPHILIQ